MSRPLRCGLVAAAGLACFLVPGVAAYAAWTATATATATVSLLPAPPATAPAAGSLACKDVPAGVMLSWGPVGDATEYDVLLGSTVVASTASTSVTVTADQIAAGNTITSLQVRATNAGGPGPVSAQGIGVHVKNKGTVNCQ